MSNVGPIMTASKERKSLDEDNPISRREIDHMKTMKKVLSIILVGMICCGMIAYASADDAEFKIKRTEETNQPMTVKEIAKASLSSVVAIETEQTITYNNQDYMDPFGSLFGYGFGYPYGYGYGGRGNSPRQYKQKGAGSGIVLSEDGYILTNNHVIAGADKISVFVMNEDATEETEYEATLVGTSESHDVAVLKIEATGLNAATFGDSDSLSLGEQAVVIGNPMGTVHGSVTAGIISAKEKEMTIEDVTIKAIQTDAAVNPGNSGGALFDEDGHVVGIVYAKTSSVQIEGIGYAIPVNSVIDLVENIINDPESVKDQTEGSKIMLGITINDVTEEISKQYNMPQGVYITEVQSMSAAERAGLQRGDIITGMAGETVKSADDLNAIKSKQKPGDIVEIVIDRNGNELKLSLVVPQPTDVSVTK